MPFKSEAQRRKFGEMVKEGKISQSEFDKWNQETGHAKLPERISKPEPKPWERKPWLKKKGA